MNRSDIVTKMATVKMVSSWFIPRQARYMIMVDRFMRPK